MVNHEGKTSGMAIPLLNVLLGKSYPPKSQDFLAQFKSCPLNEDLDSLFIKINLKELL